MKPRKRKTPKEVPDAEWKKVERKLREACRAEDKLFAPRKGACEVCRTKFQQGFVTCFEGTAQQVRFRETLCEKCRHIARFRPIRLWHEARTVEAVPREFAVTLSGNACSEISQQFYMMLYPVLFAAQDGGADAISLLIHIAETATAQLQFLALRQPLLLQPFAKERLVWPALVGRKKAHANDIKWLLENLKIGSESPHRGEWNPDRPPTQLAIAIHAWLESHHLGLGLPPLSQKGSAGIWFETGWRRFFMQTDGKPESLSMFAGVGKCKERKQRSDGSINEKTAASDARAEIKRRTKQAYLGYIKHLRIK